MCHKIFLKQHVIDMKKAGTIPHLNTTFKHFMLFSFEFDLIPKNEMVPLNELIVQLLGQEFAKKLSIVKSANSAAVPADNGLKNLGSAINAATKK